jgi:hypothetical protein
MSEEVMRPFVQVAAICQSMLKEATGHVSLIRLMDRVAFGGPGAEMQPQPLNQLSLIVILKSGAMRGKYKWSIVAETPSGKRIPGHEMPALFEGDERGIALATPIMIVAEEEGLYWFDVIVEKELLTRIPLRVMYQQMQPPPGMGFQSKTD